MEAKLNPNGTGAADGVGAGGGVRLAEMKGESDSGCMRLLAEDDERLPAEDGAGGASTRDLGEILVGILVRSLQGFR